MAQVFCLDSMDIVVSGSVGVAIRERGSGQVGELIRQADVAMYQAKTLGRHRYQVFESTQHTGVDAAP